MTTIAATAAPVTPSRRMKLKRFLRRFVAAACTFSGVAALWHHLAAKRGVRILAYHGVETPPSSAFAVSLEDFEAQLRFLKAHRHIISLDDYATLLRQGKQPSENSVILTFDDGYRDFLENAVPLLEKYRLPATCFVITAKLDDADPRFMDTAQIRRMAESKLVTVGSHSRSHRSVAELPPAEQRDELAGSKDILQRAVGRPVDYFCYPYGTFNDFSDASTAALTDTGYVLAFTSVNGVNFSGAHPFKLYRTKIEWSDDSRTFPRIMRGALDIWFLVDFFFRFTQKKRAYRFNTRPDLPGASGAA